MEAVLFVIFFTAVCKVKSFSVLGYILDDACKEIVSELGEIDDPQC